MEGRSESGRNILGVPNEGTGVRTWREGEGKEKKSALKSPVWAGVISKLPHQSGPSKPSIPHKPESSSCKTDGETPHLSACCSVNQASANCRLMLGVMENTSL